MRVDKLQLLHCASAIFLQCRWCRKVWKSLTIPLFGGLLCSVGLRRRWRTPRAQSLSKVKSSGMIKNYLEASIGNKKAFFCVNKNVCFYLCMDAYRGECREQKIVCPRRPKKKVPIRPHLIEDQSLPMEAKYKGVRHYLRVGRGTVGVNGPSCLVLVIFSWFYLVGIFFPHLQTWAASQNMSMNETQQQIPLK